MKNMVDKVKKQQQHQECDIIHEFLKNTHVVKEGLKTTEELMDEQQRREAQRPPSEQLAKRSIFGFVNLERKQQTSMLEQEYPSIDLKMRGGKRNGEGNTSMPVKKSQFKIKQNNRLNESRNNKVYKSIKQSNAISIMTH